MSPADHTPGRQTTISSRGSIPRISPSSSRNFLAWLTLLTIGNAEPHDRHADNLGSYLDHCIRRSSTVAHLPPCSSARTRRPTISRRGVWTTSAFTATTVPAFTRVCSTGAWKPSLLQKFHLHGPSRTSTPHMASSQATRHQMMKTIQRMLFQGLRSVHRSKHFKVSQTPQWKPLIHQSSRQGVLVYMLQALLD